MDYREQELNCPECGSADTKLFVHPDTDQVVHADGMYLATCRSCDHTYSLDERGADLLAAALPVGTTLHIATPCPCCGYNLQTLRIGDVCPECGNVIPRLVQRINAEKNVGMRARTLASLVFIFTVVAFLLAADVIFPGSEGEPLLFTFVAYILTIFGLNIREYWMLRNKSDKNGDRQIRFPVSSVVVIVVVVAFLIWYIAEVF